MTRPLRFANTDNKVNKLVTVFAFDSAANKITVMGAKP